MFFSKNIENLTLWIIKIIIFIIPFLPLYISSSMPFPFITGKNFAFRILVELAAVLWIGLMAEKEEYRIRNSPIVLSVLTFTFIVGLADLSGVNPINSFWSNFERMEGYVTILHLALYFMIVKSVFKTRNEWKVFFSMILLASVLVSLFPFVFNLEDNTLAFRRHVIEYGTRLYGTIGNPPFLASYLLITSFIGLILTFHTQKTYLRLGCMMAVVLNCVVIYLTATRGAILSAAAGLVIFISVYIFGRSNKSKLMIIKQTMLLLFVIFIIITVGLLIFSNTEMIKQDNTLSRFASMLSSKSVIARIDIWEKAWNGIKERPVLGWGQENFIGIYTVNPITFKESQQWMDRAHNIIIEWATNAGVAGLFSYLAIFGSAFYVLRKADMKKVLSRNEAVMIFTALMVYFIQNLFTFDTINSYMIFFALLAYIDNLTIDEELLFSESKQTMDSNKLKITSVCVTLASVLCFSIVFYYVNYKPIKQARQMIKISLSSQEDDSYSVFLKDINSALSISTIGDSSVRKSMLAVSNTLLIRREFDQEGALKFIQATVNELIKEIEVRSYDLEFMTDVINFFKNIAMYEEKYIAFSEALIKKNMDINPEYQWLNMAISDVMVLKGDYDGAIASAENIKGMNLLNDHYHFRMAMVGIYSFREDIVNRALDNVRKIRMAKNKNIASGRRAVFLVPELQQLASAYGDIKDYHKRLHYLKEIIIILPDMENISRDVAAHIAKFHVMIAETYANLGDMENAVKEAEKAVKINPDLSEDIKVFIDSINN